MRPHKYNINNSRSGKEKRTFNGIVFSSILEMRFYKEVLFPKLGNGEIKDLRRQVKYELQPPFYYRGRQIKAINYILDFVYTATRNNIQYLIDVKGSIIHESELKYKMITNQMKEEENIKVVWVGYSKIDGGWVDRWTIEENRKLRKKQRQKNEKFNK